ncbi:MAG: hypothetical protein AAF539_12845 [Planctomycetota bacterium]
MPNDLEDFLKRAAALRQRKAAEQKALDAESKRRAEASRARPYSNRRRERRTQLDQTGVDDAWDDHDEPILVAEIVEPGKQNSEFVSVPKATSKRDTSTGMGSRAASDSAARTRTPSADAKALVELLRAPGGIKQAFLMREILNRPKF